MVYQYNWIDRAFGGLWGRTFYSRSLMLHIFVIGLNRIQYIFTLILDISYFCNCLIIYNEINIEGVQFSTSHKTTKNVKIELVIFR